MEISIVCKIPEIRDQVEEFLAKVREAEVLFHEALAHYLKDEIESFEGKLDLMVRVEHRGDDLRRSIEENLYRNTLIPQSRSDVLELLEKMDHVLDYFKGAMWKIDIERPRIPREFRDDFMELADCGSEATEALVSSCRAFFSNINDTMNHMHKVIFWETQADIVSTRLSRKIFSDDSLKLSHKRHLREFARLMEKITNEAEDVVDRLSIYIIKRLR